MAAYPLAATGIRGLGWPRDAQQTCVALARCTALSAPRGCVRRAAVVSWSWPSLGHRLHRESAGFPWYGGQLCARAVRRPPRILSPASLMTNGADGR